MREERLFGFVSFEGGRVDERGMWMVFFILHKMKIFVEID